MDTKKIIAALLLLSILLFSACQGTETTNPLGPVAANPTAEDDDLSTYTNDTFGVSAQYPNAWELEESTQDEADVVDTGGDNGDDDVASDAPASIQEPNRVTFSHESTIVIIDFITLDTEPLSLAEYLSEEFPNTEFEEVSTAHLSGLGFEGEEYYFLNGIFLIHIITDVAEGSEEEVQTILNSIQFIE